jgi:hypothetical protein
MRYQPSKLVMRVRFPSPALPGYSSFSSASSPIPASGGLDRGAAVTPARIVRGGPEDGPAPYTTCGGPSPASPPDSRRDGAGRGFLDSHPPTFGV